MTNRREILDLSKTAVERTRRVVELVVQLVDDDVDSATVMMAIATDMIDGSAQCLKLAGGDDVTEEQALGYVLKALIGSIGISKVRAAILAPSPRKKRKEQTQ